MHRKYVLKICKLISAELSYIASIFQGIIMFCVIYFTRDQIKSLKGGITGRQSGANTTRTTRLMMSERKSTSTRTNS